MSNLIAVNKEDHKAIHSGEKSLADVNKGGEMTDKEKHIKDLKDLTINAADDYIRRKSFHSLLQALKEEVDAINENEFTTPTDVKRKVINLINNLRGITKF